jgi:hypothetical protein
VRPYLLKHAGKTGKVGDGCVDDAGCEGALCLSSAGPESIRYCSGSCADDSSCPSNMTCSSGACRYRGPAPGTLGSACAAQSDCRSFLCLHSNGSANRSCSQLCIPSDATNACPAHFECRAIDDNTVPFACVAVARSPAGDAAGCSVVPLRRRGAKGTVVSVLAAMLGGIAALARGNRGRRIALEWKR